MSSTKMSKDTHSRLTAGTIRFNIIIPTPLTLFLIILLGTSIHFIHVMHMFERETLIIVQDVEKVVLDSVDRETEDMKHFSKLIQTDQCIQQAWLAKNRNNLLQCANQINNDVLKQHNVTHFYFHDASQVNFLRVHNPPRHDDFIDRYTMQQAHATGQAASGIELGKFGTLTLRLVIPWIIQDKLIGYTELGMEIDHLVKDTTHSFNVKPLIMIEKRFLQQQDWEEGTKMLGQVETWGDQSFVLMGNSMDKNAKQQIATQLFFENHKLSNMSIANKEYFIGSFTLIDANNSPIGKLVLLQDITDAKQDLLKTAFFYFTISLLLFCLLIIFFWKYLGKIDAKMISQQKTLEKEITKQNQTLAEIDNAVTEAGKVMHAIALGDCSQRINKELIGGLNILKTTINHSGEQLETIVNQAKLISYGDYSVQITPHSEHDILGKALAAMLDSFRDIVDKADKIANGDLSVNITPKSEQDTLGIALQKMTQTLRDAIAKNARQNWLKTGETELNDEIRGIQTLPEMSCRTLNFIAKFLNAQVGLMFVRHQDNLTLTASYAYKDDAQNHTFELGEGLVGQVAKDKKTIIFTADANINIHSGSGVSKPKTLIIVPLIHEEHVRGVLELGTSSHFTDLEVEFLNTIATGIAINIHSITTHTKMTSLLEATNPIKE